MPLTWRLWLALAALGGCATLPGSSGALPPLPPVATLECCWQSEEQVQISSEGGDFRLHAAVVRTATGLTVVILDNLGRRQLTLAYDGGEFRQLTAPADWDQRRSHYLLVAIFLHHALPGPWHTGHPAWRVTASGSRKTLSHGGREVGTLTYAEPQNALGRTRTLTFNGQPLSLVVTTLSRRVL